MRLFIFLFSVTCLVLSLANNAHSFYCGSEPIGRWDTKEKVYKYCGKPSKKGSRKIFHRGEYIFAETWYYNCGYGDFVYALSFFNNIVIKDEPSERGSGINQCGKYFGKN